MKSILMFKALSRESRNPNSLIFISSHLLLRSKIDYKVNYENPILKKSLNKITLKEPSYCLLPLNNLSLLQFVSASFSESLFIINNKFKMKPISILDLTFYRLFRHMRSRKSSDCVIPKPIDNVNHLISLRLLNLSRIKYKKL